MSDNIHTHIISHTPAWVFQRSIARYYYIHTLTQSFHIFLSLVVYFHSTPTPRASNATVPLTPPNKFKSFWGKANGLPWKLASYSKISRRNVRLSKLTSRVKSVALQLDMAWQFIGQWLRLYQVSNNYHYYVKFLFRYGWSIATWGKEHVNIYMTARRYGRAAWRDFAKHETHNVTQRH